VKKMLIVKEDKTDPTLYPRFARADGWILLLEDCCYTAGSQLRKEVPLFCKNLMMVYHNYTYLSLWNFYIVLCININTVGITLHFEGTVRFLLKHSVIT